MVKYRLIAAGLLVVGCLVAVMAGFMNPAQTTRQVTLANYNHRGEFTYTAYAVSPPAVSPPAAVIFPKILKDLTMFFAYSSPNREKVVIKAYLEDKNAGWQKEIPLDLSGGPVYSFPLDVPGLLSLGNTINTELGGRGTSYQISIEASVGTAPDTLDLNLIGDLSASSLIWHEDGFSTIEKGFPGNDTLREAAFGYSVGLLPNSLFGPVTVERPATIPTLTIVQSGEALVSTQITYLDIGFRYQLVSGVPVNSISENASLDMTLSETGGWSKTYTLVAPVKNNGALNFAIPVDVGKLLALADANDTAAGSRASADRSIAFSAQVHTTAITGAGVIDETFNQQLTGKIGKVIALDSTDKTGASLLTSTKAGKLSKTDVESNAFIQRLRLVSLIFLAIAAALFLYFVAITWMRRPEPSPEDELKRNRKKYGELISEVGDFPSSAGTLVNVPSLKSLVKISNNSLKPILLKIEGDRHLYRVIDDTSIFEYVDGR